MARPSKALISRSALRHNYQLACSIAPNSKNIAVIKANAYGHGDFLVAQILEDLAPAFAVACIEEALALRKQGITKPIMLLEGVFEEQEIALADKHNFWIMVVNKQQCDWIVNSKVANKLTVWLKVDTGMHRLGLQSLEINDVFTRLYECHHINSKIVLASHFSNADDVEDNNTEEQMSRFLWIKEQLQALHGGKLDLPCSLANSPGILAWPDSHFDWNRPGFMLYGNSPLLKGNNNDKKLKPVMTLVSEIISIRTINVGESVGYGSTWIAKRPSKIATVAIGYGDGYPRIAKSGTPTLVNGKIAPLAGRVSMDMITIDVTDHQNVKLGDEVILWGPDLLANKVGEQAQTIGYEILTRMPLRTPRVVVK